MPSNYFIFSPNALNYPQAHHDINKDLSISELTKKHAPISPFDA
jgi:hypothetical protein